MSSHPFIDLASLGNELNAYASEFCELNELNAVSWIQASWLFPTGGLENL